MLLFWDIYYQQINKVQRISLYQSRINKNNCLYSKNKSSFSNLQKYYLDNLDVKFILSTKLLIYCLDNYMFLIKSLVFILLVVSISATEEQSEGRQNQKKIYRNETQQTKLQQKYAKNSVNIFSTNFKTYNFKLNKTFQFLIKAQDDKEIKGTIDILWNQNNVYLQANVHKSEEINLKIQDQHKKILYFSDSFYTGTGFSFEAEKGKIYKITAEENGQYPKIVLMRISEAVNPSQNGATKQEMLEIQNRLKTTLAKISSFMKIASENRFLQSKISSQILSQSTTYSYFQIFEAVLIILTALLEVKLIRKLLKNDIIV